MIPQKHIINYWQAASAEELSDNDRNLIETARAFTQQAYAPYSKFHVAATVLLQSGKIVSGTNQENASYPIGVCAERSLLNTVANVYNNEIIEAMAISYYNHAMDVNSVPASPCGMCRQALNEWCKRQGKSFRLLISGQTGPVLIFEQVEDLLPFGFSDAFLK